jgi:hypothetical protein
MLAIGAEGAGMGLLRGLAVVAASALAFAAGGPASAQSCPQPGLQFILDMTTGARPLSSLQFPTQASWPVFMHRASPLIAFAYPPGWQAIPLEDTRSIGVLLRSPDGAAALQIYAMPPQGAMTSQQAAQLSIGSLLGQGTRPQVLCARDFQVPGVYPMTVSFLGVTTGQTIAATVAAITHDPSTGGPAWVDMRAVAAPAKTFDAYLQQAFLPVFAQLQMGGGSGGGGGDDGDEGTDDGGVEEAPGEEGGADDGM